MTEIEFRTKKKQNLSYIQNCINKVNELARQNDPIRFFSDRLNLIVLACNKVTECQDLYLEYCNGIRYEPKEVIKFDYTTSEYANRLYSASQKMIRYYLMNKEDKKLSKIEPKTIININLLSRRMCFIAARWFSQRQMECWDMDKPFDKQKLPRRLPLLKDVMPCFDRVLAVKMGITFEDGFNPKRLVVCVPPSSGKTYEANVYTNQMLSHHFVRFKETGIIRMTNTADNAFNYGNQVYKMMTDERYVDIFPEYKKYLLGNGKLKSFTYESREKYLLKDCLPECSDSMFLFGEGAGINGKRALLGAIIDDLSNGQEDMDNDEIHKKITDKVMSDVLDRSDDDDCPIIIMGTMYNENDVQNAFISLWEKKGLVQHPTLKNVKMTKDGKCAICLVDIEDENGKSIAPDLYTDEKLQEKRDYFITRGKPYVYNLIYRQHRDSREPKTFADDTLMHYKWGELPKYIDKFSLSMMDLTRTNGNDFFANPYLRYNQEDGLYYLTDAIFEQKSLGIVYDPKNEFRDKICKTIINNNTIELCVESNTSNTTGALLKGKCQELGYKACKFRERFTSRRGVIKNKTQRILNMEEIIKNYIVFPDKSTIPVGHPLFQAMEQLNNWNSKDTSRKNHDDFPDVLALFAEEFIFKRQNLGEIGGINIEKAQNMRFF